MNIHASARKHGIKDDDIAYAATWAVWIEDLDENNPSRQLRLGFDRHAGNRRAHLR